MKIEIFADGMNRHDALKNPVQVACRAIVLDNDKVLAEYIPVQDLFNIPGGRLEKGETLEQCCLRELKEETGVDGEIIAKTVTIYEYFPENTVESHFYLVKPLSLIPGQVSLTDEEIRNGCIVKWYNVLDLLDILESYVSKHPYGENIHQREMLGLINSI